MRGSARDDVTEYKRWCEAAARRICRAWRMGLSSAGTECIIRHWDKTSISLIVSTRNKNVSQSCLGEKKLSRGGVRSTWSRWEEGPRNHDDGNVISKIRSRRNMANHAAGLGAARRRQTWSADECNITSMNLHVKVLIITGFYLGFPVLTTRESMSRCGEG